MPYLDYESSHPHTLIMPVAVPSIPSLAAGATLANPKLARPLAPKEPPARDYGGYTDLNIPTVTWPGDKKVALNISIHFEEGAEATVGLSPDG